MTVIGVVIGHFKAVYKCEGDRCVMKVIGFAQGDLNVWGGSTDCCFDGVEVGES